MSNCVNDGDVSGSDSAESGGGIAGKNNGGKITNCVNYKTVSGSQYAGGVVGYTIYYTNTTSNCVNYGDVSSSPSTGNEAKPPSAGGVVGLHENGTLSNCVSSGNVTNTKGSGTANAGGVVGTYKEDATISNCGWLYSQANSKGVGSSDVTPAPEPVSLDQTGIEKSVVVLLAEPMNITLRTGDTAKITLDTLPGKPAAFGEYVKNITVPSDSEKISAKVNEEKGEITLTSLKEGTSAVSVSADLYTTDFNNSLAPSEEPTPLSLTIYVSARRTLGGITLSPEKMNLRVGESGKFTATVTAEGAADQTINWHSSNEKIATVDNEGNVKALAVGEATITAMTADGKHDAAAKVTVANRHSSGNGCAAGVGALALFALIPLLLRKKKS
ncbi:Ig-like domain-containing protein [Cloacibacillus porcorum]|uniref:Ig-like domain-containing protein n=1 Tax=Cloacibacillus porcorum TaxID=1197717 RepID=UPI002673C76C|nr:Ig-like domain-containing protein [Cloacibacillus porcorum]